MTAASGHRVQVRWRDLDALGHVNHVVVLTYLEEGRDAWLEARGIRRDEYVVGRCTVTSAARSTRPSRRSRCTAASASWAARA